MNIRWCRSQNIGLVADGDIDFLLRQHPEKNAKKRLQFLLINGLVAVDVQQIKYILDIVLSSVIQPHKVCYDLYHFGELEFGEPSVAVLVEFLEDFLNNAARIRLRQLSHAAGHQFSNSNIIIPSSSLHIQTKQQPSQRLTNHSQDRIVSEYIFPNNQQRLLFSLAPSTYSNFNFSSFCSEKIFWKSLLHLFIRAIPFLCCSSLIVASIMLFIQTSSRSRWLSSKYSPEYIVCAKSTAPQCSFGSSLKILGYFDLGFGTEAGLTTLGRGGGFTGIDMPLMPGIVAENAGVTTLLKSQGILLGIGGFFQWVLSFLLFFSFFTFFDFLSFLLLRELQDQLSEESLSSDSELDLSFFFFFSSFFRSFFFSLCFFFSPINQIVQFIK